MVTEVTSEDMDQLSNAIAGEIRGRGLRQIDAAFSNEAAVLFSFPETSLGDALDIAASTSAPFVSVHVGRLDKSIEELDSDEDDISGTLHEMGKILEQRDGEIDSIVVRWVGSGLVFAFLAIPEWVTDLNRLREGVADQAESLYLDSQISEAARINIIADQLEAHPDLRRAAARSRMVVGAALAAGFAREDDEPDIVESAIRQAVDRVRDGANLAQLKLETRLEELVAEIIETPQWTSSTNRVHRISATQDFLREHSDGYSTTKDAVDAFRQKAELFHKAKWR